MFAVDVCALPSTGSATGIAVAALFLLVLGVVVARWVRASAGRLSVVAVVPILLMALVGVSAPSAECGQDVLAPTTTTTPTTTTPTTTTTVVPVDPNLVLEIDTTMSPEVAPGSLSSLAAGFVYELGLFGDVDVNIDWGDGLTDEVLIPGPFAHTYQVSGQYTITVNGSLTGFGQDDEDVSEEISPLIGAQYLTSVNSFGDLGIKTLSYSFWKSENLTAVPASLPSSVTVLDQTFLEATSFNGHIGDWDTSNVVSMIGLFNYATSFNGDISRWDTSNVTSMYVMFHSAESFNVDLGDWDTGNVTDLSLMFMGAFSFNQNLNEWDTSNVIDMVGMFKDATSFNGDISGWDTGNVFRMTMMFENADSFDRDIGDWDTSKVTNMYSMFLAADSFNQNLADWDTGKVTDMSYMFLSADSFNQSLGAWDIGVVTVMSRMLDQTALSVDNYDATLIGWEDGPKQNSVVLGASGLFYSNAATTAHNLLTSCPGSNWQIADSGNLIVQGSLSNGDQPVDAYC